MKKLFLLFMVGMLGFSCSETIIDEVKNGVDGINGIDGTDGRSVSHYFEDIIPTDLHENGGVMNVFYYDASDNGLTPDDEIINSYAVWNGNDGSNGTDGKDADPVVITKEATECGYLMTFTVGDAVTMIEVCNGADGIDGNNGVDGIDGDDGATLMQYNLFEKQTNGRVPGWMYQAFTDRGDNGVTGSTFSDFLGNWNAVQTPSLNSALVDRISFKVSSTSSTRGHSWRAVLVHFNGSSTVLGTFDFVGNGSKTINYSGNWFDVAYVRIEAATLGGNANFRPIVSNTRVKGLRIVD